MAEKEGSVIDTIKTTRLDGSTHFVPVPVNGEAFPPSKAKPGNYGQDGQMNMQPKTGTKIDRKA